LIGRGVDGIILVIPEVGGNRAWLANRASDLPVPVIIIGGMDGRPNLRSIAIDNFAIGCLATEHLLAGGARHVGIVTGPEVWWDSRQRQAGWQQTLLDHGRSVEDSLIYNGDWTVSSGEPGLRALLDARPDIDAVFACNDQMALGVLLAAHRLGIAVPERLGVAGVDDMAEASHFWPPLTTVHQPLAEAGELAVREIDLLIARAGANRRSTDMTPEMILLEPTLIIRESSRSRDPRNAPAVAGAI
jgi:LacI family transcriptional regulator